MKKILLMVVAAMMATNVMAQFPEKVKEVLKKSEEKMASYSSSAGMVIDGTVKMKVSILSFNGTAKIYAKDRKFLANLSIKAMEEIGIDLEMGFDGEQKWEYHTVTGDDSKDKDTLKITKTRDAINDFGPKSDYDKEYKNAKMKESGLYYEITFSGPLKKDVAKKTTIKIAKDSYLMREYSITKDVGPFTGKITITITKITKGCSDSMFKLDMNKYKNAVVVRR